MSTAKEIRSRISSVTNTKKITKAMEMISASKLKKLRDRMEKSLPYAKSIRTIISHLAAANAEYQHAFMVKRDVKRVGAIIVTSDRALCGGLNINLYKKLLNDVKAWEAEGVKTQLAIVGSKGEIFLRSSGVETVASAVAIGDTPTTEDLIGITKVMLDKFTSGEIDALHLYSNEFVNTITQNPLREQLLPIDPSAITAEVDYHWDYIYEPDARDLMNTLLHRLIESLIYQGVVQNIACEQAARMMAMRSASDNAQEVIESLKLQYNKARQAAITQELAEIVSGSDAV